MARILVHVEGQTEETFVNVVLAPHLLKYGHYASARLIGNARLRLRRGGIQGWPTVSRDIVTHLLEDSTCYATTMVDYYALPQTGIQAWPGRAAAGNLSFIQKAPTVQRALASSIANQMEGNFDRALFLPYVMMHEFEGLLFSDCEAFARGIGRPALTPKFEAILQACESPEKINDSPLTAPSKRVEALVPGYEKPFMGTLAVLEIGLERIREKCPLFNTWITSLEALT